MSVAQPPQDITIQNIGGVRELEVTLATGVNVLLGPNGSGKTSAMRAIERAYGGDVPLEVRDGAGAGRIQAPGVDLRIKRVVKASGQADVELADPGPLAALIDPGIKDSTKAAQARIRALLRLVHLPVTEETIATLAGDTEVTEEVMPELQQGGIDDLLEAAERVRLTTHQKARAKEGERDVLAGHLQAHQVRMIELLQKLGGSGGEAPEKLSELLSPWTPGQAAELAEQAVRALEVARVGARQRQQLEERQAAARTSIGEPPNPARFDVDIEARRGAVKAHEARIVGLERQIARERELMAGVVADLEALERQQTEEVARQEQHREAARVLALPVEGPLQEDVERLAGEAAAAKDEAQRALLSGEYRAHEIGARQKHHEHAAAAERAEILRSLATTVQNRLGLLLHNTEAEGLTVVDGRLAVVDGTEIHDFELRRSEGQRIEAALRVAARTYHGCVLPLDGRYWAALDAEHRAKFARLAKQLGLYVVTELPEDGELRAVNFNQEVLAQPGAVS